MNEAIPLYSALTVICLISVAFLALAFKRRSKGHPVEIGAYMACFLGLAVFAVVFGQGIKMELDPGTAHPSGYNGGEGCHPDCLPASFDDLEKELNIK